MSRVKDEHDPTSSWGVFALVLTALVALALLGLVAMA
jgi:hypothetical protein